MIHGIPTDYIVGVELFLFIYFISINSFYALTGAVALLRLPWYVKLHLADPVRRSHSRLDQPVTFVVAAFNEEASIVSSLRSILAIEYANFEVIVVNDGSRDRTLWALDDAFELEPFEGIYRALLQSENIKEIYQSVLHPELRVIDKANGGKGDALNAAINLARYPLIFCGDADSYYHPQALQWMTEPFQKDARTVAVGGVVAVAGTSRTKEPNEIAEQHLPHSLLERFQVLEYLRAFLASRMGFAPFNGLGIVSGACGLWRKDLLIACGGFRTDTLLEDMEMSMRLHNYCISTGRPYRVAFTPYPACWTEVPRTIRCLYEQRKRWHRHLCESVTIHRRMLFGEGGFFSWITVPYFVFFEWLAPAVVLFGVVFSIVGDVFGFLDVRAQIWLLGLMIMLAMFGSLVSILLDEISFAAYGLSEVWDLFFAALIENFGYRQFVMLASFSGFLAWLFRRPANGRKNHPGLFVKAWRPNAPE